MVQPANGMVVTAQEPDAAADTRLAQSHAAPSGALALAPKSIDEAFRLATMAARANLYGVKTAEEAFIRMATGMEVGLSPWQSLRSVYVIENRPSMSADLIVALCLRATDVCEYFRCVESTDKIATYVTKRVGQPEVRMSWTIEQAEKAGLLTKSNWKNYSSSMLRARCSSALARTVYPDLILGLYTPDEISTGQAPGGAVTTITADGEVVSEPVSSTPASSEPPRNFAAEADALISRIAKVSTKEEKAALRADIDKADLPAEQHARVGEAYNGRFSRKAQGQGTTPPATTTAPAAQPELPDVTTPVADKPAMRESGVD